MHHITPQTEKLDGKTVSELLHILLSEKFAQSFAFHNHKGFVHESFGGIEQAKDALRFFTADFLLCIARFSEEKQLYFLVRLIEDLGTLESNVRSGPNEAIRSLEESYKKITKIMRDVPSPPSEP